ncbi:LON peptidase substrate-binding domain-containing protein, partial [Streptomyces sp. NPDC059981]
MASTSVTLTLPVLPLDDEVVLPGMVVPLDLSDAEVRGAVEAAQAAAGSGKPRVLLVPRVDGKYAATGVLGTVEQVGRLSDGDPGALIRGRGRVRIGAGTTGPGAALWVEGETVDEQVPDPLPGAVTELVKEYK